MKKTKKGSELSSEQTYNINATTEERIDTFSEEEQPLPNLSHLTQKEQKQVTEIFNKNRKIMRTRIELKKKHDTEHRIELTEQPKKPRIYPIPMAKRLKTKEKLDEWLANGILERGQTHMVSPISVQEKADGSIRPCGDYQAVNKVTLPDIYPLPRMDEIIQKISGNIFSKLDLKDGYFQIPIRPEDKHKTAITTTWEFTNSQGCRLD